MLQRIPSNLEPGHVIAESSLAPQHHFRTCSSEPHHFSTISTPAPGRRCQARWDREPDFLAQRIPIEPGTWTRHRCIKPDTSTPIAIDRNLHTGSNRRGATRGQARTNGFMFGRACPRRPVTPAWRFRPRSGPMVPGSIGVTVAPMTNASPPDRAWHLDTSSLHRAWHLNTTSARLLLSSTASAQHQH